jgi:hypothetical protein
MKELEESKLRFFITTFAARVHNLARRYGTFRISTKDLSLFETCFLLNKDFNYGYCNNTNYGSQHKAPYDKMIDRDKVIQYTNTIINSNPNEVLQILNKLFEDENGVRTAAISIHSRGRKVDFDLYSCNFQVDIIGDINNSRIIQYMMNEGNTIRYPAVREETITWDSFENDYDYFQDMYKKSPES